MKIAIPVVDEKLQKFRIADSLNVTGCLCIFDTYTQEGHWMKTLDLASNMGELLPAFEREAVLAVITRQIHPLALQVLKNRGVEVYRSDGIKLNENLRLFGERKLIQFDMEAAMNFAKVCGGECGSCKTDCDSNGTEK